MLKLLIAVLCLVPSYGFAGPSADQLRARLNRADRNAQQEQRMCAEYVQQRADVVAKLESMRDLQARLQRATTRSEGRQFVRQLGMYATGAGAALFVVGLVMVDRSPAFVLFGQLSFIVAPLGAIVWASAGALESFSDRDVARITTRLNQASDVIGEIVERLDDSCRL